MKVDGLTTNDIQSLIAIQRKLLNILENEGPKTFVIKVKQIRLHLMRYISGQPLKVNKEFVSLDKSGFPSYLKTFKSQVVLKDHLIIRHILTTLTVSKAITGDGKEVDFEPITREWKGSIPEEFINWLENQDITFGVDSYYTSGDWEKFHFSTKSGPNGLALASSLRDLTILHKKYPQLLEDIQLLGNSQSLNDNISNIIPLIECQDQDIEQLTIRKLSIVNDKESKNRVIAIFDYWSQTVLKSLHDSLMRILRNIKQDRTFNQEPLGLIFYDKYFSYDLKNATDRFPVSLIVEVMKKLIGEDRAMAWKRIMVDYEFTHKGKSYSYGAGQPMGAYSSWPSFALCHHLIVRFCIEAIGQSNYDCYMLLGDDIVISDSKVALYYKQLMSTLDVEISETKTFESTDSYEFAKRFFISGIESSPFPHLSLYENRSNPFGIAFSLYNERKKGWYLTNSFHGIPDSDIFSTIYKALGYGKRSIKILIPYSRALYLANYIKDNYSFDMDRNSVTESVYFSAKELLLHIQMDSCNRCPIDFLKNHFWPLMRLLKVDKARELIKKCDRLLQEEAIVIASTINSLPHEYTSQVSPQDIQESWPIYLCIKEIDVKIGDAMASLGQEENLTPKSIMDLGSDLILPDVHKYSSLRRLDVQVQNQASLYHTAFKQWVQFGSSYIDVRES